MYRHNARLSGVLLIHGLLCAADFEPEEEGKPDIEDAVQQLISILDPDTSTLEASSCYSEQMETLLGP